MESHPESSAAKNCATKNIAGDPNAAANRWNMKAVSLWLAGPSAVLVFLNQLVPFWSNFVGKEAEKATVVVEHRLTDDKLGLTAADGPKLTIEAARFSDPEANQLDMVFQNRSDRPVFLKEATVEVLRGWKLKPIAKARGALARSAEYDITLPVDDIWGADTKPVVVAKPLNQEVPAGGLDRFSLSLGVAPASNEQCARVYHFRLSFAYGSETISAGDFVYMTAPPEGNPAPKLAANAAVAADIKQAAGIRNPALEAFLNSAPTE